MFSLTRLLHFSILSALFLLIAAGCTSTSPTAASDPAPPTDPTETPASPVAETKDSNVSADVSTSLAPVYFDTGVALLRPEARNKLKRHAKSILDHPEWGVLEIEGHCDERGSDEYNLALGMRRATAVERLLVGTGVPTARLTTRTFGSMRPVARGHGETAWRYNRRSELRTAGVLASISR